MRLGREPDVLVAVRRALPHRHLVQAALVLQREAVAAHRGHHLERRLPRDGRLIRVALLLVLDATGCRAARPRARVGG